MPEETDRQLNAYYCDDCHGYIVTEHVDDGVTPMFLACRVKGDPDDPDNDCKGKMVSMMYPKQPWPATDSLKQPIPTEPTWEWYRPSRAELVQMDSLTFDHVSRGGLVLRQKVFPDV